MRYVCLSDTHGHHDQLVGPFAIPDGDVLVHAGDFTAHDSEDEQIRFLDWLTSLAHPVKVLVAGNHDGQWVHRATAMQLAAEDRGLVYLEHASSTLTLGTDEATVFGSPWTPEFYDWHFMYARAGERAKRLWEAVPEGLDVLVTHGPPQGVGDTTFSGTLAGCEMLGHRLNSMCRPPLLHVFGHIHEAAGVTRVGETTSINASVLDGRFRVVRAPVVVELSANGNSVVVDRPQRS